MTLNDEQGLEDDSSKDLEREAKKIRNEERKKEESLAKVEQISLRNLLSPEPKEFPLHVFPDKIQAIIIELRDHLNYPPDFTAGAILHAASVAIGNSCTLRHTWEEQANLFMVLVGKPGTIKSHPVEFALTPILDRDRQYYEKYLKEKEEYEIQKERFQKNKGAGKRPIKPQLKRHIISDTSMEAIKQTLVQNKRGVGLWADELAAWLNSFKKYSSALEQWLTIWSRKDLISDRVNKEPVRITSPFVSVIGTIQPEIIEEMAKGHKIKNGFLDRMLFIMPDNLERKGWSKKVEHLKATEEWKVIINHLLDIELEANNEGKLSSKLISFSEEAQKSLAIWQGENIASDRELYGGEADGIAAKNDIYVLRLALILHLLHWACGESAFDAIDTITTIKATDLAEYFKYTSLVVYEQIVKINPLDRLSQQKTMIYHDLYNISFSMASGLQTAARWGMPERTFKMWLATDKSLFRKVRFGVYKKVYERE